MFNKNELKQSINYLLTITAGLYGDKNDTKEKILSCTDVLIAYSTSKNADSLGHELIRELDAILKDIERLLSSEDKVGFIKEIYPIKTFLEQMKHQLPPEGY